MYTYMFYMCIMYVEIEIYVYFIIILLHCVNRCCRGSKASDFVLGKKQIYRCLTLFDDPNQMPHVGCQNVYSKEFS